MKLSDREKRLLAYSELNAGDSVDVVARRCAVRSHTARYFLRKFQDNQLIDVRRPVIDMNRLGFKHYTFLFSLTSKSRKEHDTVLRFLSSSPSVTWLFEIGGNYHYGVSITVRSTSELPKFLEQISLKFGNIVFRKVLALQVSFIYFGRRYLATSGMGDSAIQFELASEPEQIDELDERILTALANEPCQTLTEFARRTAIPLATFERRKQALEQRKIIRGYFYWIQSALLGMQTYTLHIRTSGLSSDFKTKLIAFARREPSILFFTECLGEWDFELGVEVQGENQVTQLTQRLYDQFPEFISELRVFPIFRYLKFKSYLTTAPGARAD